MLAVTRSEHGNSYLQLVYRVVGVVVVCRTGMLVVTGSGHGNSYLQLVYRVVGVVVRVQDWNASGHGFRTR